jgi:hypothetical protein
MKLLWGGDLKVATVHVLDLCRAIFHVKDLEGVFNVADSADTKQEDIGKVIHSIFGIKAEYYSRIISNLASLQAVAEEANEIHMGPWAQICQEKGVDSPIYPYVEEENLDGSHLAVNTAKLQGVGFVFQVRAVTQENVRESLRVLIEARVLPDILA